jgi:Flp pilus assembly protein TadD
MTESRKKDRKRKKRASQTKDHQQVELLPQTPTVPGDGRLEESDPDTTEASPPEGSGPAVSPAVESVPGSDGTQTPDLKPGDANTLGPEGAGEAELIDVGEPDPTLTPILRSQRSASWARIPTAGPESDPDSPPGLNPAEKQLARARGLVKIGRIPEAIEQYQAVLADNPDNLKAYNNLGVLYDELGRYELAVEHFQSALSTDPENVEVLTNHARALTALARYEDAAEFIRRALRSSPDDPAARFAAAILSFRRGLYAQAEPEFMWICEQAPDDGLAFYYRGEALNRVSRYDEAIEVMLRAAELLPNDSRPYYTLGHLYDRRSMREEATDMYRRARDVQGREAASV